MNFEGIVSIMLAGKDISHAMRPLVSSFFGTSKEKYTYIENVEDLSPKADSEAVVTICLKYTDSWLSNTVFLGDELFMENESVTLPEDIREYRYEAGRSLYAILEKLTGKSLPWGILVGIRPTKHVYEAIEAGKSLDWINNRFRNEFLVNEEKTNTSIQIATLEKNLLDKFDYRKGYSLYIGIPFCPTTCLYCSFPSYPLGVYGKYMDDYVKALEKEMAYAKDCFPDRKLNTIYIGGGTPTALDEAHLEELLINVHKYFPVNETLEFSVEAGRPDSITMEKLQILKKYGVTRISINPQSLVPRTLEVIGRRHSVEQVYEAFKMAREAGLNNINLDMIIGLTGENPDDVAKTLCGVSELNPESLTVHTLAVKRAARLKAEAENYKGLEATGVVKMLDMTISYAREHGYKPYYLYRQKHMAENLENTGYAKPGYECLYNILIMEEKQTILALGSGATTKYVVNPERIERCENVKSLTDYITRTDEMIERKKVFLEKMKWI